MKKVIVVSKTHLDLGFTDYAEKVREKYLTSFIPSAIELAESLNKNGKKNFVWTTGSWLIKEALESGDENLRLKIEKALREGNIAPHAMAFTTHSELMDKDLVEYNLSIVKKIDQISGVKTIAGKMTDVPGHTKALVPILADHGIKLLHIGINSATTYPKVPECFVWKCDGKELVVIYADGYGGDFKCPFIDEILYFDNTTDNHGTRSSKAILKTIARLKKKYPDYEVTAGRLDDIAESLWAVRNKLPAIEDEIGDTWIHGVATAPFKVGALRRLCNLKTKWLEEGKLSKDSVEYQKFADNLICVCEHTWGMDSKMNFCDTENYEKDKFKKANIKNIVKPKRIFGDFPYRFLAFISYKFGDAKYSYGRIEKSWLEQSLYIDKAISALPEELKKEGMTAVDELVTTNIPKIDESLPYDFGKTISLGVWTLTIGKFGGVNLYYGDTLILNGIDKPLINYRSYGAKDFDLFGKQYLRHHKHWAVSDYLNPGLKGHDKYPQGVFDYQINACSSLINEDIIKICANFVCDPNACDKVGAPHKLAVEYTLSTSGLNVKVIWKDKDAVRSTESTAIHFYPMFDSMNFVKISSKIDPKNVISGGGRKLSVIQKAEFEKQNISYELSSVECPLVATEGGNLLNFDNCVADIENCGLTFILHNNMWATNFPLWYDSDAMFTFDIKISKTKSLK